jgi:lysophospholipase L1-like esterase
MGNSGDITPVMLHRVTRGNLDFPAGRQPKVAVMLCGINNFGVTSSAAGKEKWDLGINCPPQDIAAGQRAIAQVFRRRLPHTRLIMVALLPVAQRAKWEKCQQVNAIQAAVIRNSDEVAFINLQDSFLLPDGTLNKSLFTDGLHLSAAGYQVWANGIAAKLDEFAKAPPLAPVKIMLVGGAATEGVDSSRSYRSHLDGMLRQKGHLFDFVGSRQRHDDNKSEADSYQFDPDHEGHAGKNFAWFAENMPRLLEQNTPDIAVLQLGADDSAQTVNAVIASLRAKNPAVKIVLAHPDKHALSTARPPIVVANIGADANTKTPSAEAAQKIAAILVEAISPLIPARKTVSAQ